MKEPKSIVRKPVPSEDEIIKSEEDLTEEDLLKGLSTLESFCNEGKGSSRKEDLLQKALSKELDPSEKEELFGLLGGSKENEETDSVYKGLVDNETIQTSLDVSDFLTAQHTELVKALGNVEQRMGSMTAQQNEFNLLLAKGLTSVGKLVGQISDRLVAIEEQPVSNPKATNPKALAKSFSGKEKDVDEKLNKSLVMDTLVNIIDDRLAKGLGTVTEYDRDLVTEVALLESSNQVHPKTLELVKSVLR
jgi:hypothetical protein